MASTLGNGNVTFGDSTTQSSGRGVAVAWGRVNGQTTLAGSLNVSSVGYSGGHYYAYWATSMGSTSYNVIGANHSSSGGNFAWVLMVNASFTASQCDCNTNSSSGCMFLAFK